MDSIIKTQGRRKCIVDRRNRRYRLVKGDLGVQVRREPITIWGGHRKTPKRARGDIQGFSEHSRSRLRVLLSTARWNGGECARCGLTLTLPWAASPDEWRKVWSAYVKRIIRFNSVGMIWRIELTTGKAKTSGGIRRAHVHAIFWLPVGSALRGRLNVRGLSARDSRALMRLHNVEALASAWWAAWQFYAPELEQRQIEYATTVGTAKGSGVVVKWLDNSTDGAIHYLCDHASKHKEEQLGWKGRQWGVVNRHNFTWPETDGSESGQELDGNDWVVASRQLRRLGKALRRQGDVYAGQPYGDNKCFFGKPQERLERVLTAVKNGCIGDSRPTRDASKI